MTGTRPDGQPWRKYRHVFEKCTYEELPEGLVKVTDDNGRSGIFRWDGPYVEGEITQASVHMLTWCGGPEVPPECRYRWSQVPVDLDRPSGWPEALEKILGDVIFARP